MTVISKGKGGEIIDLSRITVSSDNRVYDVIQHIAESRREETEQTGRK